MEREYDLDKATLFLVESPNVARIVLTQARKIPQGERLDRRRQQLENFNPLAELADMFDFVYFVTGLPDQSIDDLITRLPKV